MNQEQCPNCGASPKNWPLWADYRLFHILADDPVPGTQHKVGAALITNAPADKVAKVCVQARKGPISTTNWLFVESELHRLGFFAVIAKWEVRFM